MAAPARMVGRPRFRSPAGRAAFDAAYQRVQEQWGVAHESVDLTSECGSTRVQLAGPPDAPPVLLLPGGGATSAVWFDNVAPLAARHRLLVPDLMGDAGYSVNRGRRVRTGADLTAWLTGVLDGLGIDRVAVCGHSYGAWIGLTFALARPDRASRLALLDPTDCFAPMSVGYRVHALPVLVRPGAGTLTRLLRWETNGLPLDPAWTALAATARAQVRGTRIVLPHRPSAADLRALAMPLLVVLAGQSRAHRPEYVAARVRELRPEASVEVIADATHHTLPFQPAGPVNDLVVEFFRESPTGVDGSTGPKAR